MSDPKCSECQHNGLGCGEVELATGNCRGFEALTIDAYHDVLTRLLTCQECGGWLSILKWTGSPRHGKFYVMCATCGRGEYCDTPVLALEAYRGGVE